MEQLLNRLLVILDDQVGMYRSLLAVYHEERQAILAFELEDITASSKKKENLILKVRILEEQRAYLIDRIADVLKQPGSELTIARLAEKVDIRFSYKLSAVGNRLASVLEQLKGVHSANRSLIAHARGLVSSSLAFLHNNLSPDPVYRRDGRVSGQDHCGRLITRTI
jgi:flagellar biosynthesis/type III secretory pathway chaperone